MSDEEVTYWDYLKIEQLLQLQGGLEGDYKQLSVDELHFIIIHQVFELWFKQLIAELELIIEKMDVPYVGEDQIPFIVHHLNRVNKIIKIATEHWKVMETLTPQDFLLFRSKLGTASGFQSFQMRQIEMLMGLKQSQRDTHGHGSPIKFILRIAGDSDFGKKVAHELAKFENAKSLRDCLHDWLFRTPIHGSTPTSDNDDENVDAFITKYLSIIKNENKTQLTKLIAAGNDPDKIRKGFDATFSQSEEFVKALDIEEDKRARMKRIRASILFIESYRELPLLTWPRTLIDQIVEMEEAFVTFRFNHARMVERIIGRRIGTGGSAGVDYLDQTTKYRIFPELWAVRSLLLAHHNLPKLLNKEMYKFASELSY
ncbi:MAG: tryptophan 2,3-dioxygenase [Candidatus Heimdallarchaeota archaeon]|nr:tryptophan 2,3-dioxygenase [Candidatus Heimdallarchaeota archaeon]